VLSRGGHSALAHVEVFRNARTKHWKGRVRWAKRLSRQAQVGGWDGAWEGWVECAFFNILSGTFIKT
ncbi:MAG: hypothetical protein M3Z35_03615, partial [Nitrospirota bacterium]|nr:hypothetical protein [Nitrospirota bacterium]